MGAMAKQDITIYYTSDLHGHFYPTTYGDKTQRALGLSLIHISLPDAGGIPKRRV